ncbi:hypothetical protein SPONL_2148 [uncultured Candidatus Thioglobus sp.]|nr:hypothetical protein SPONL_2148 [uncultured Candidatus Thioglobus sp.]
MEFTTREFKKDLTSNDLIKLWADADISEDDLSVELEWLDSQQENNKKYAIFDNSDNKYPMVYETTSVRGKYLKTLKVKHAPYMLDKFYESMNFNYLTELYKHLIQDIVGHSDKQGIKEFRIYIDNDNTIAVLAFQLFSQLLLPDNYESKFSSCKRWLFVNKK